ncbi:helix-turn-helix domain-containing protein [Streptomyces sp. 7N604]|uniref:helix-turn-helix domain-containing protein n=1 Tax=Streptomyces sp. 7N604 TaxID=3457415 RepID=UPI003FD4A88C
MSDAAPDRTCAPHPTPAPEPPTGLTGAPAAIYSELVGVTEPATVAELALAAGVGRSTAGKALTTLEQHGLAVRTPGGHNGPRRTPDHWHAAPTHATSTSEGPGTTEQPASKPEPSVADAPEPVGHSADSKGGPSDETARDTPTAPDDGSAEATAVPTTEAPQDPLSQDAEDGDGDASGGEDDEGGNGGSGDQNAPAPQAGAGPQTAPPVEIILPGEKKRLAPGALRQMVIAHLQAHPSEALTATKISRVIEKSSGAIANALVTLARQGVAEQVSEHPRTYRLAAPERHG